ncbi:MAG: DUF4062 domain-containing protein [Acidobacteriota bacterium]
MPQQATHYRVFIASPGGLDDVREAFYETLRHYNEDEGIHDGVHFDGVGWEGTLQGRGRPQELINEDLRTCDYFVLVLWDRWGSPPAREGESRFSSGCEEEFFEAETCLASDGHPMQQLVVLFRGVAPERLADPDPQLDSVLDFRGKLEAGKRDLYGTFDEVGEFRRSLRRALGAWRRAAKAERLLGPPPNFKVMSEPKDPRVEEAERLEREGKHHQAETGFAQAILDSAKPDALLRYGHFLRRSGREVQARTVYERVVAIEKAASAARGSALCSLSHIYLADPASRKGALDLLRRAIADFEAVDDETGRAFAHWNLSSEQSSQFDWLSDPPRSRARTIIVGSLVLSIGLGFGGVETFEDTPTWLPGVVFALIPILLGVLLWLPAKPNLARRERRERRERYLCEIEDMSEIRELGRKVAIDITPKLPSGPPTTTSSIDTPPDLNGDTWLVP